MVEEIWQMLMGLLGIEWPMPGLEECPAMEPLFNATPYIVLGGFGVSFFITTLRFLYYLSGEGEEEEEGDALEQEIKRVKASMSRQF